MVYIKPQLTVIVSLQCNLIYLATLLYLIYNESIDFKLLLVPYIIETLAEAGLIQTYWIFRSRFTPRKITKKDAVIAWFARTLAIAGVLVDMYFQIGLGWIAAFLVFVPGAVGMAQNSTYNNVKTWPVCFSIIMAMVEMSFLMQMADKKGMTYSSGISILFFYFLSTMFFSLVTYFRDLCAFFAAMFSCFRSFNVKAGLIKLMLGTDPFMSLAFTILFMNWIQLKEMYPQNESTAYNLTVPE